MNAVNVSYYHNTDKMIQAKSKLKAKITDQPPPPTHTQQQQHLQRQQQQQQNTQHPQINKCN